MNDKTEQLSTVDVDPLVMRDEYAQGFRQYRFKDNPLEQRFAEEWVKRNRESKILLYLTSPSNRLEDSNLCERDKIIAGSVIQWLGTPVGQGFLRDVLGVNVYA